MKALGRSSIYFWMSFPFIWWSFENFLLPIWVATEHFTFQWSKCKSAWGPVLGIWHELSVQNVIISFHVPKWGKQPWSYTGASERQHLWNFALHSLSTANVGSINAWLTCGANVTYIFANTFADSISLSESLLSVKQCYCATVVPLTHQGCWWIHMQGDKCKESFIRLQKMSPILEESAYRAIKQATWTRSQSKVGF